MRVPSGLLGILTPAILLLGLYSAVAVHSLQHKSLTYDEPAHLRYGQQVLAGDTERFDDSKMPVTALNILPSIGARYVPSIRLKRFLSSGKAARMVTVAAGALLGLFVFLWSLELWGLGGAVLSLGVYILSPDILAHSRWATTDLYGALGILAGLYAFDRWMSRGGAARLAIFAATAAFAQAAKFSAVYLYPLCLFILIVKKRDEIVKIRTREFWLRMFLFTAVTLVIINSCYLWNGSFRSLSDYEFKSGLFQALQSNSGIFGRWPLPLPAPFLEGLDWTKFNELSGAYRGPAYLWGKVQKEPFSNYFLFVFIFKTPVPVLWMLVWAFLKTLKLKNDVLRRRALLFVWIPALFFLMYFNFLCAAQMGSRMMLMVYPFIHVAVGVLAMNLKQSRLMLPLTLAWLAVSVLSYHPHYLSYSNELIWNKRNAYRVFADSNLDWGQNAFYAKRFMEENPGVRLNPEKPVTGKILVSVNFLTGIVYPDQYAWYGWLRENLDPVRHVAHSYLLYDVPAGSLAQIDEYMRTHSFHAEDDASADR